jgi:L,D-transpeptidase catalytic domain
MNSRNLIRCKDTILCTGLAFALVLAVASPALAAFTKGRVVAPFTSEFKAGDYVWHPEVSPSGPVVIIVSLPDQIMYVYRNGVRVGRSTVSTGKPGKRTPTGVFTVLQKKVQHESNIYKGAKMPHMHRLTWSGIAMHAGQLPGYPASAGCVRMPEDFAERLYSVTSNGTTVIIADNNSAPSHTTRPGALFSGTTGGPPQPIPVRGFVWTPEKATKGPVSIIVSARDGTAHVYRNGVEIGHAVIGGLNTRLVSGTHVFCALATVDSEGRRDWLSSTSIGRRRPNIKDLAKRVTIPPAFRDDVRVLITPGTTLIVTDQPVSGRTHSARGFNILTAEGATSTAD